MLVATVIFGISGCAADGLPTSSSAGASGSAMTPLGSGSAMTPLGEAPPAVPLVKVNQVELPAIYTSWIVGGRLQSTKPPPDTSPLQLPRMAGASRVTIEIESAARPVELLAIEHADLDALGTPTGNGVRKDCIAGSCGELVQSTNSLIFSMDLASSTRVLIIYLSYVVNAADLPTGAPAFDRAAYAIRIDGARAPA